MNFVQGKSRGEGQSFSKQIGVAEWKVIAFNPDKKELESLLGIEVEDDPEYVKQTREEDTLINLKFWLQAKGTDFRLPAQFMLIDKTAVNKDGNKYQYINQVGMSAWAEDEADLPEWFTHFTDKDKKKIGEKSYRLAYKGEAEFYGFLRSLLTGVDFFHPETDILLDTKKLFRGNFTQIKNDVLGSEYAGTVTGAAVVNSYEKDGETKYANRIWSREFLPGYAYETWKKKGIGANKAISRFFEQLEGHCKDVFSMTDLKDYDPEMPVDTSGADLSDADY